MLHAFLQCREPVILDNFPFSTDSEDEDLENVGDIDSDDEVVNSASATSSPDREKPLANKVFFRCHKCSYQTQIQHLLDRHVAKHLNQLFQCPSCDYSDEDSWTFVDHWVEHHQQTDMIQCSFCSLSFRHPRTLKLHITDHLPVETIDCYMCEFSSSSVDLMKSHVEVHHTEVHNCDFNEMMTEHELIEPSQNVPQPVPDSPELSKNCTKAKPSIDMTMTDDSEEIKRTFAIKTSKSGCGTAGHYDCFCSPCSPQKPELQPPLSPECHSAPTPKDERENLGSVSLQLGLRKSRKRRIRSSKRKQQQAKRALKSRGKSQPSSIRPSPTRVNPAEQPTQESRPSRAANSENTAEQTQPSSKHSRVDPAEQQTQQIQQSRPSRADPEPCTDTTKAVVLRAPNNNARKKFLCRICNYSTDFIHRITYHKDHIHSIKYKCQYCPVVDTKYGLMKHVKMKHGVVMSIQSGRWRYFTRIQTGKLVKNVDSSSSRRVVRHSGRLSRHSVSGKSENNVKLQDIQSIPKVESQSQRLECCNCPYKTKFKSLMRRHVLLHLPEGQFSCPKCNFKENRTTVFANHVKSHSRSKGSLDCCFCRFSAANMTTLIMHLNTHRGVDSYYCSKCKYSSPGRSTLHRHFLGHHVTKHACPECHQSGTKSWVLWHIKKRHPTKELIPLNVEVKPPAQKKIRSSGVASNLRSIIAAKKAFCRKIKYVSRETVKTEVLCCKTCEYQTEREDLLTRHEAKHVPLKCPICGLGSRKGYTFALHLIRHNPSKSRFRCFYCQRVFKNSHDVYQHLATHVAGMKKHDCPKCEFSSFKPGNLRLHIARLHITGGSTGSNSGSSSSKSTSKTSEVTPNSDLETFAVPSTSAVKNASDSRTAAVSVLAESKKATLSFKREIALESHKKTAGEKPKYSQQSAIQPSDLHPSRSELLQCNDCPYKTKIKPLMRNHVKLHLPEGQFVCPVCDFKENQTLPFVNHLKTHSKAGDAFMCCYCSYSSAFKYNLEQHLCQHRSVSSRYCSKCDYSCAHLGGLIRHTSNYHVKQYACSVCPKMASKFRIAQHFKSCHPQLSFNDHPPRRAQTQKRGNAIDAASDTAKRSADKKLSPPTTERADGESVDLLETQKSGMTKTSKYSNISISPQSIDQLGEVPKESETPSKSMPDGKDTTSSLTIKNGIATKKQDDDSKSLQRVHSVSNDSTSSKTDVTPKRSSGSSVYSQLNLITGTVQSENSALTQVKCPDCDFRTIREDLYQRHVAKHIPLICPVCNSSITDHSNYTAHLIRHNMGSKKFSSTPYRCCYCGHVSKRSANLFCHLATHVDALKKLDCPLCEFSSHRGDFLRNHFSIHLKPQRNIAKTPQSDKGPLKSEAAPEATLDKTDESPSQSMMYSDNQKSADSSQIGQMQEVGVSPALLNPSECSESRSDHSSSKMEANFISVSDQNVMAETIQTLSSGDVIPSRLAEDRGNCGIDKSCQESASTSQVNPSSSDPVSCPNIVPTSSTIAPSPSPAGAPDISLTQPLSHNSTTPNTNIPETQTSTGQTASWTDFIKRFRKSQ